MLFSAKASVAGLDVGSSAIKAVVLRRNNGALEVERAGIAPLPPGAFSGGVYLDPPAVSGAIRKLCRDSSISSKTVATALAGEEILHIRVRVQRSPAETLADRAREEAVRAIPFPADQTRLDFHVIDHFPQSKWVDVLYVAAAQAEVDRLQGLIQRAGKTAVVLDTAGCALANVFEANYFPAPSDITALVHVGAALMTLCILRGGSPLIARDIALTAARFSTEQTPIAERVTAELRRVLDLMDENAEKHPLEPGSGQIQRLLLSGGGARMRGLDEMLQDRLGLPVEELNPFLKIGYKSSDALSRLVADHAHCMGVAVGLALRGWEEK